MDWPERIRDPDRHYHSHLGRSSGVVADGSTEQYVGFRQRWIASRSFGPVFHHFQVRRKLGSWYPASGDGGCVTSCCSRFRPGGLEHYRKPYQRKHQHGSESAWHSLSYDFTTQ